MFKLYIYIYLLTYIIFQQNKYIAFYSRTNLANVVLFHSFEELNDEKNERKIFFCVKESFCHKCNFIFISIIIRKLINKSIFRQCKLYFSTKEKIV